MWGAKKGCVYLGLLVSLHSSRFETFILPQQAYKEEEGSGTRTIQLCRVFEILLAVQTWEKRKEKRKEWKEKKKKKKKAFLESISHS